MRAGKRFSSFISDEDMNDSILIIKSLEDSNESFRGLNETRRLIFFPTLLASLAVLLMQSVISSMSKYTGGRGFGKTRRGYMDKYF